MHRRKLLSAVGAGIGSMVAGPAAAYRSTANEKQPFNQQLKQIEEATKRYRDMEQALQEGYKIMGPYVPAMGWHFTHPEYAKKAAKQGPNLVEPPVLTYNLDGELGAVEYAVPLTKYTNEDGEVTGSPDLFNDENADVKVPEQKAWHPHYKAQHVYANGNTENDTQYKRENLLNPNNWVEFSDKHEQFPDMKPGLKAGDEVTANFNKQTEAMETRVVDLLTTHPSQHTLHVWVHHENPHGVFAGYNPEFDPMDPPSGGHDHEH